jgi:16S rRNA (guanine527-N7)-methyltransferase
MDELIQRVDSPREAFTDLERSKLDEFHRLLVEWNQRMNLTGITEYEEVYVKHFLDSVLIRTVPLFQKVMKSGSRIIDVGTGAGFPGIPLALCFPEVDFVLCDSLKKRLSFLEHVITELELQNVTLVHGRAEDLGQNRLYRGQFDAVVSRAVARLNLLMELMCPFLKIEGTAFCYKGPQVAEEMEDGIRAGKILGAEIGKSAVFELPFAAGSRTIVPIIQRHAVPKVYPRQAGIPQKSPL